MRQNWKFILVGLGMAIVAYVWGFEEGSWGRLVPHLWVQRIDIEGCHRVAPELIAKTASVTPKTSIVQVDLKTIAQNVESLSWVRSCEVRRVMPNTLSLRVVERKPVALVNMVRLYYLDEDGTPFAQPAPGESLDYPVVTGLEHRECPGNGCTEVLVRTVRFLKDLRNYPQLFREGISEIHLDAADAMTIVTMKRGIMITLGPGQLGLKLRRLEKVLKMIAAQRLPVQYIIAQYCDRIVVGLRERR